MNLLFWRKRRMMQMLKRYKKRMTIVGVYLHGGSGVTGKIASVGYDYFVLMDEHQTAYTIPKASVLMIRV